MDNGLTIAEKISFILKCTNVTAMLASLFCLLPNKHW